VELYFGHNVFGTVITVAFKTDSGAQQIAIAISGATGSTGRGPLRIDVFRKDRNCYLDVRHFSTILEILLFI
jgi:hypothetical protein